MAASTEGFVPITREYLSAYYDKYPLDPVTPDAARLCEELGAHVSSSLGGAGETPAEPSPKKLDHNLWKNRAAIEEAIHLLRADPAPAHVAAASSAAVAEVANELEGALRFIEAFQVKNTRRVTDLVFSYLPNDFRGTLIRQQKDRSDAKRKAELDALVSGGATIQEKYALMWKHQLDKRQSLSQLASTSGMFKAVISYIGGIPQVLLDFLEKINDDNGPLEEQRMRYGPAFYQMTSLSAQILSLVAAWLGPAGASATPEAQAKAQALLEEASGVYVHEIKRIVDFIDEVFANSPFLIKPEEAGTGAGGDDVAELTIGAGGKYEAALEVGGPGVEVSWSWRVDAACTIDFGVAFRPDGDAEATAVADVVRVEHAEGSHASPAKGEYVFSWDNSFAWVGKNLAFKISSSEEADPKE